MDSLFELKEFFVKNEVPVKEYNGWSLVVNKDTWGLAHGVFYCNNVAKNMKDKKFISEYLRKQKNDNQSTQTRKWRGISSRNYRGD